VFVKIFLVFTAVVSVLLAGVSMVAFFAVPGMQPAMAELNDYSFEAQAGEKTTWTVTHRLDDRETVSQNSTAFGAVSKARADLEHKLQTETLAMGEELTEVNRQFADITVEQTDDVDAITRRIVELEAVAANKQSQTIEKSGDFQDLSVKERITRDEMTSRRRDVVRFQEELDELRTHLYELVELRRTLTEQLLRIKLDNHNLEQREDQIRQQLAL
jgi:DNA repair exonuclease SbcCD ATPase subunit